MTTTTRKPRTIRPAKADILVERRMAYPCELLPEGQPARIVLNGKPYVVTHDGEDAFTFHGLSNRSCTVRGWCCDCEDFIYVREARGEPCKHVLAWARMKHDGTI